MNRPLIELCPGLLDSFGHRPLGELPTPVMAADRFAKLLGVDSLHLKRDDLSGHAYGGNKVRKLEFLLADAIRQGADSVITFGCAGSNHALATAIYAKACGLKTIAILTPQTNSHAVQRNLLAHLAAETDLRHLPDDIESKKAAAALIAQRRNAGRPEPVIVPGGGSSGIGTLGFVNAAFELKAQVDAGELPAPDVVYVALGTMGTAAGLAIGLRAAGLDKKLVAVRVVHEHIANPELFNMLAKETLQSLDGCTQFPSVDEPARNVSFRNEFFGKKYGVFTEAGLEAIAMTREQTGIKLEGTYTGKAFAALIADARAGDLKEKSVVFWNTYNSSPLPVDGADYHQLPAAFHSYFERPVQPLDAV